MLIFVFVFLLMGCDGYQSVEGLVIDSETKKPITNVDIVDLISKKSKNRSDENGYFEISEIKGFVFGEKELTVIISKENYLSDTITFVNNEQKLIKICKIAD
jgi:hypothetical protein